MKNADDRQHNLAEPKSHLDSYVRNCFLMPRKGDGPLIIGRNNGDRVARLDGYVIIPVEAYTQKTGEVL